MSRWKEWVADNAPDTKWRSIQYVHVEQHSLENTNECAWSIGYNSLIKNVVNFFAFHLAQSSTKALSCMCV